MTDALLYPYGYASIVMLYTANGIPPFIDDYPTMVGDCQIPLLFANDESNSSNNLRLLSLFSGCGGMDIGFEGGFIAHRKSFKPDCEWIEQSLSEEWLLLKKNVFTTVFANDILPEAQAGWDRYMSRYGDKSDVYHLTSIVDLVKMHQKGVRVFPDNIDIVTGGFPCQDFSIAGKRKGFDSMKDHEGKNRAADIPTEESRGKLYYWMKQVIDITRPKIFIAENVKGMVSLGDVTEIIQRDFASADGNGYIVLKPQVLHAGNYGVPESRERIIFIGIRTDALLPKAKKALEQTVIPPEYNPYPPVTHACTIKGDNLLPVVTTLDVLHNLPEPDDAIDPAQKIYSKAKFLGKGLQGQTEIKLDDIGPTIRSEHHGNIEFRRLSREHGGTHMEELERGLEERRLTPRECAMIQTFPPDYQFIIKKEIGNGFLLSSSGAYKVIGNAVPPVLAYHIAKRLENVWPLYFGERYGTREQNNSN